MRVYQLLYEGRFLSSCTVILIIQRVCDYIEKSGHDHGTESDSDGSDSDIE